MIKKYWNIFILNLLVLSLSVGCSKTKMVGSDEGLLDAEETVKEITSKEFEQAKKREEIIKSGQGPSMTLMVYMIGSDLEAATAAATNDMNEMLASGLNSINALAASSPFKNLADVTAVQKSLTSSDTEWDI